MTNEVEPINIIGYIALVRHVLDYYSDDELIRKRLLARHHINPIRFCDPGPRLVRPDPSPEELLNERLTYIDRHPDWRIMRDRLDELQQYPFGGISLVEFVDESMTSLKEIERSILSLRFNLDVNTDKTRTWDEVRIALGNKSRSFTQERGERAMRKLRTTSSFQIDIPRFLLPVDPKIVHFRGNS